MHREKSRKETTRCWRHCVLRQEREELEPEEASETQVRCLEEALSHRERGRPC